MNVCDDVILVTSLSDLFWFLVTLAFLNVRIRFRTRACGDAPEIGVHEHAQDSLAF